MIKHTSKQIFVTPLKYSEFLYDLAANASCSAMNQLSQLHYHPPQYSGTLCLSPRILQNNLKTPQIRKFTRHSSPYAENLSTNMVF